MPDIFWPAFLVVVGLAVVLLELMIPSGGILSAIAGIAMLASIVLAFIEGGAVLGTIFMGITAVLVPAIMLLFIRIWPRTPMGKRVLINPPPAEDLVPKEVQSLRQCAPVSKLSTHSSFFNHLAGGGSLARITACAAMRFVDPRVLPES